MASLQPGADDPRSVVVRSSLRAGVAEGLVAHAVATDGFDLDQDYEPGTLGAVLIGLVRQLGLDREWPSLRSLRSSEPALFDELIQHVGRLWAEGA
jgi:hypothetical protein